MGSDEAKGRGNGQTGETEMKVFRFGEFGQPQVLISSRNQIKAIAKNKIAWTG